MPRSSSESATRTSRTKPAPSSSRCSHTAASGRPMLGSPIARRPSRTSRSTSRIRRRASRPSPPPTSGSRANTAPAPRYSSPATASPAGADRETKAAPPTAPTNEALIPATEEIAFAVTSSCGRTVRGSEAPLAARTSRDVDSSRSTATNAPASHWPATMATAARTRAARTHDMTTRTRRRDHRSITTPANGPTRLNGRRVTASTDVMRAGVAPGPTSKTMNCAKEIWASPSAAWPRH